MEMLFNTSNKYVLIKDMSDIIDFKTINNEFDGLSFKDNIANKVSNEMNLFDKDIFKETQRLILEDCKQYLNHTANLGHFYEDLVMTNSWGNITDPGHSHHEHVHPFSIVSGVLYLDDNPSNLNLYVESFMPEIPYFITKNKSFVSLKSLLTDIQSKPEEHNNLKNHMILFLSNSSHFVEPISTESLPRKSISFNTFWKGNVGVKDEALGSHVF
jgi:hypothetical protein